VTDLTDLTQSYDDYPRIEEEFQGFLDESLGPRGPDFLYDVLSGLSLTPGANVLDLGCGEGQHTIPLARDHGFVALGIDPVPRNLEIAKKALDKAIRDDASLNHRVRFSPGAAESIPADDDSIDLIWCKEVLMFADLERAVAECHRVLREDGRMLIYQVFRTDRLEPAEAEWFGPVGKLSIKQFETAFTAAGFVVQERVQLTSEGGEYGQETTGEPGRRLLHAARLLRDPERYITRYGRAAYDIMLSDCFWHVYRMLGKLAAHVYILRKRDDGGP
jgi:SAM-dependent methyltransferase